METNEYKIIVNNRNATAKVFTPYNEAFVQKIRTLDAVWDKLLRCWWISAANVDGARQAMMEVFGRDDIHDPNALTLKLTFSGDWGAFRSDCVLFGKILSRASSRSSGGFAGKDVTYLSGKPESGGSTKNWCSIVPAGAVIQLNNVPRDLLRKESVPPMATVEVLSDPRTPKEILLEEKSRLEARLAEIEALLSATT